MQINVLEYLENGPLRRCREKVAFKDENRSFTFKEVERISKNCATMIMQRNSTLNQPVAVFLPKCAAAIIANLGILYAGNCYSNLDIKSPPQRLKSMLQNLGDGLIITTAIYLENLLLFEINPGRILFIEEAFTDEVRYDNACLMRRLDQVIDTNPVYIIYTSGSSGVPKGVVISHRSIIDYIDWARTTYCITQDDVIGNQAPLFFDNSTLDVYLCLSCGATLTLIPEELFAYPIKLMYFVSQSKITLIFWVPSVMISIANFQILEVVKPPLRKILFAGEVMPTRTLNYWRRVYPQALFSNLYGPTEITVDCTYYIVDREFDDGEKLPIGYPCRNTNILILNESNRVVKGDEPGELCVRGSSLALGYWNNLEKSAAAFVQNPLNHNYPEKIYRTGDLVYQNRRGEIVFLGRKDFQIKHFGYRIELGEIEHAIFRVSGVKNACVVYNQNKNQITLFFESTIDLSPGYIRQNLLKSLPKYMLPTAFHRLESLPVTANGKTDRMQLTARLA